MPPTLADKPPVAPGAPVICRNATAAPETRKRSSKNRTAISSARGKERIQSGKANARFQRGIPVNQKDSNSKGPIIGIGTIIAIGVVVLLPKLIERNNQPAWEPKTNYRPDLSKIHLDPAVFSKIHPDPPNNHPITVREVNGMLFHDPSPNPYKGLGFAHSDLGSVKTASEAFVGQVKDMGRQGRISAQELDNGRELYTKAKAEFDGCIEFLCTTFDWQFNADNVINIEKRMKAAKITLFAFISWAEDQIRPKSSWQAGLARTLSHSDQWLMQVAEHNDKAIEIPKKELRQCKMRSWGEIAARSWDEFAAK
jgi:hypothetical protein